MGLNNVTETKPTCNHCGSVDIVADATVVWNIELGSWEVKDIMPTQVCVSCQGECSLNWVSVSK